MTDVDEEDSILDSVSDSFSELSESVSDFVSENIPGIVHSPLEFKDLKFKLTHWCRQRLNPRGAGASKLGRFSPFSVKIKVFLSTNFSDETIKITAINFSIESC